MRAGVLGLLASCIVAPAGGAPAAQPTVTVTIESMQFRPADLTVHPGERIVWVNKDLFPHTVTAVGKAFDSGSIAANASWSYTPPRKGEYPYGCSFHPTMKGMVRVQ